LNMQFTCDYLQTHFKPPEGKELCNGTRQQVPWNLPWFQDADIIEAHLLSCPTHGWYWYRWLDQFMRLVGEGLIFDKTTPTPTSFHCFLDRYLPVYDCQHQQAINTTLQHSPALCVKNPTFCWCWHSYKYSMGAVINTCTLSLSLNVMDNGPTIPSSLNLEEYRWRFMKTSSKTSKPKKSCR
jgi:hypothetical protein